MTRPTLQMMAIRKRFPGVQALDGADLSVEHGEVHCLLGANGAGKSTLIKVLAGAYRPDEGEVLIDGLSVNITSPTAGLRAGISVIYQELDLVPDLTVEQNLLLGRTPSRFGIIHRQDRRARAQSALERVGARFPLTARVRQLSVVDQQLTAIAKALTFEAKVIVMDEPSATLSSEELTKLFGVIRALSAEGHSVVYITHRLEEVFTIGDRATVMRDGRSIDVFDVGRTTEPELVAAMIGEHTDFVERTSRTVNADTPLLRVQRAHIPGVLDIRDLEVLPGEIVGLAGLAGSGRTTFLRSLFGVATAELDATFDGRKFQPRRPSESIRQGIGLVPENRKEEGLVLCRSVSENITLADLARTRFTSGGKLARLAQPIIRKLNIRISGPQQVAQTLSGGNQQKVVLGKWILKGVRLLLLDEPSRGLDVGAKEGLYVEIRRLADEGRGCIVASSELPELMANCDRVIVFYGGRNTVQFDPDSATADEVHRAIITGKGRAA
jgi:ribose transport system ATP-binding protein